MCCFSNRRATLNLAKKMNDAGGKMTFWKVIDKHGVSILYTYAWKAGINRAVFRDWKEPSWYKLWTDKHVVWYKENIEIHEGIHVYTNLKQAQKYIGGPNFLLEVECDVKDLVGSEKVKEQAFYTSAVFTKVKVTAKEWKKFNKDVKERGVVG